MHSQLRKQIKKFFPDESLITEQDRKFFEAVDEHYKQADDEIVQIKRIWKMSDVEVQPADVKSSRAKEPVQAESEESRSRQAVLEALNASSLDGILAVSPENKILSFNPQFIKMWMIPQEVIDSCSGEQVWNAVFGLLQNPDEFLAKVNHLDQHPDETGRDEIRLKDGRVFEHHTRPLVGLDGKYYGRLWSFRDITQQAKARNEVDSLLQFKAEAIDVVKRGSTEVTSLDSQGFLQTVMDNIPESIFWKDENLTYLGCNRAFAKDAGFSSPAEVIGKTDWDMPWKDQAELYRADDRLVMDGQEPKLNYEEPQTTPDGSTTWLRTSKIPLKDATGKVYAVLGMYEDITEHKLAEENLLRLQNAMEQTDEGIALADMNGNLVYVNPAWAKMHGHAADGLPGNHLSIFHTPEQLEQEVLPFNAKVISDGSNTAEIGHVRKDGTTFPALMSVSIQRDRNGAPVGMIGTARDITDRRQMEQSLRESEARYSAVVKQANDGIIIIQDNIIKFANQALASMLGYDRPEEIENTPIIKYIAAESQALIVARIKARLAGEEVPDLYEARLLRKDGIAFDAELSAGVTELDGKPADVGLIRDITERKRMELVLRDSQEFLQTIMDNIPESIFWKDENLTYLGCNRSFADDAGFASPADVVGKTDWDMPWKEQAELYRADDRLVMEQRNAKLNYEEPQTTPDGYTTWLRTSKIPLVNSTGKVYSVLGMYEDITERKQLEQQVQAALERRTFQVRVGTQISQQIASATDLSELYKLAVKLVKEEFGYYHAQLLRYDPAINEVVLIEGYGETGARMKAMRHRMPMGIGLIGTAAETGQVALRPNLKNDPDWKPNPLLPETKGEIAVPIKLGDEVLGVLDVQSSKQDALDADDQLLLEGLCGQIAIAIEGTRLRSDLNDQLLELHALQRASSREGWQAITQSRDVMAYVYEEASVRPLVEAEATVSSTGVQAAVVPIAIRDEVIGTLGIYEDDGKPLSPEEQELLESISGQVAQALESARLFEQTQRRAAELQTVATVSTVTSTMLDPDVLLQTVVDLTKERFALYHAHIYVVDEDGKTLLLAAGAGEVGRQMVADGWNIALDHPNSIVATAAKDKTSVIAADVRHSPDSPFLSNRLLPNTRSEMAIPMIVGDKVLGVFDVQSDLAGGFTEEDANIYTTLASQVAVALQNARQFTQLRQAEESIRLNEARLADALKIARLGNWEYDVKRDVFTFNDQLYSVFHTTVDKVGGYELSSAEYASLFVHPEDAELVGLEIGKSLSTTERHFATTVEHRVIFQDDGSIGYIVVNVNVDRDENGEIVRWYGANQDITERKNAEIALYESEQRYQQILDAITDMVLVKGEKSRIVWANRAFRDYYGMSNEQLHDMIDAPTVEPDYTLQYIKDDAYVYETGNILSIPEEPVTRYDGVTLLFETVKSPIRNTTGNVTMTVGVSRDITERKRAQETLRRHANQLETVAVVSSTASTVLDPDNLLQAVVDLTKERFSLYHAHIYLVNEDEQSLQLAVGAGEIGRQLVERSHSISMDAEVSLVARAARGRLAIIVNDVQSDEGFLPNPLLPDTRAEMAVPMIVGNKVLGVFDVQSIQAEGFTEEDANIYTTLASQVAVALQNARLYVEQAATLTQLRELDRLKSSFLANMSHELRTPLNSILGFADVMLEELDGPLTDNMQNDLALIQKNGKHLLHLINDVLDMAKIEAGKMNLSLERFNIQDILEDVTSITQPFANSKSLAVFIEAESDRSIDITADRTRIRQVMLNIVNNAIKFTEAGWVSIHAAHQDSQVLIRVRDTGISIPPENLETIFQEFTQVDTSSTRKTGGTGLGLPISRRLVEMHGGRLWAESNGVEGEGSTFFVELPIEARLAEPVEKMEK